jgi:hypothetical protein
MVLVFFTIDTVVSNHFKIPIWDVADKKFYEIIGMELLNNLNTIFVPMVEEGNKLPIIFGYSRLCHNRFSGISEYVFDQIFV